MWKNNHLIMKDGESTLHILLEKKVVQGSRRGMENMRKYDKMKGLSTVYKMDHWM